METQEWKRFVDDGDKYLSAAINSSKRRKVFTPELIYNIVAIAIEKHLMGYLLYHRKMPENHTLRDLTRAVREISPFSGYLEQKISYMDSFQEICCLSTYNRRVPDESDVSVFFEVGREVQAFVEKALC